jgi:XTP/dITP diphosphohydrolase
MMGDVGVTIRSLGEYPELPEVEEDGTSFLENALKKARTAAKFTGEIALADDSGLEVAALNGAPGIYSSRYAGNGADDAQNNRKLLDDLRGIPSAERGAAFRCVLVLCWPDGRYRAFEGGWAGRITEAPKGEGGFGYDPVFFLPECGVTVAELSPDVKNRISHRAQAFAKLKTWLLKESQENGA